ncbi:MAG TPA: beta-N-acetylglucosaminidase domain-containing protein [Verrucomicrobiota bacterium]|nr:beta-N-acetylglucosaminidase domain-containing protein [Verrucomicrobiota bacterium]
MLFQTGVIEGFYGRPWTATQRHRLFGWMRQGGLTTYVYAPKDDVKHRTRWRLRYTSKEADDLRKLIADARRHGIDWVYALGPGLDIEHGAPKDAADLRRRAEQLLALGVRHFALLFDDIAPQLSPADRARFPSVAAAQAWFANQFLHWLREQAREVSLWFCPTPYCARMCEPSVSESVYLRDLGELLAPEVDVFWTGPEIVSESISIPSMRELSSLLRRPPLIWDNLYANDYDLRRIYFGPYSGRPAALKEATRGILINPNCEFDLNFVPIHTLAAYARNNSVWNLRTIHEAWRQAIRDWIPEFHALEPTLISEADVTLLADCFYLPYSLGPTSQSWLLDFGRLLGEPKLLGGPIERRFRATGRAIQQLFDRLTALTNRDLLYSLYRHVWELKEEVSLMLRYLDWLKSNPLPGAAYFSGEHRAGTYRGGLVAELQRLLPMDADGGFNHLVAQPWNEVVQPRMDTNGH